MNLFGKILWPLAAVALLASCGTETMQLAGTETGNGTSGMVVGTDGKPAIGARVTIVPVNYNELQPPSGDFMIATTVTDSFGRYIFNPPIPGYYNLFGETGVYKAYLDSVRITGHQGDTVQTVALKKSGSVAGSAFYSSGRSIDFAFVALQGSRIYAAIDPNDGAFYLSDLAPGRYCAKVITRTNGYFDLPLTLSVEENHSDTMPTPFLLISNSVTSLMADTGGVWIGTANGLANLRNGNWRTYGLFNGLSSSRINCLALDKNGATWVGTSLWLAEVQDTAVSEKMFPGTTSGLLNITAIAVDSGNTLWIGTPQGLFRYDGAVIAPASSNDGTTSLGAPAGQNELTAITAVLCLRQCILAGTQHGAYYRDSSASWHEITALKTYAVSSLVIDQDSTIWIGTNQGLYSWNRVAVTRIMPQDSSISASITSLAVVGSHTLCIGTANGLFLYGTSQWEKLDFGLSNSYVTALASDWQNILWVGTNDGVARIEHGAVDIVR
jgi:hypothetical protein